MTSRLSRGWPRQCAVRWPTMRCAIVCHVLVPGGRWLTALRRPVASASRCSAACHRRARALVRPPPSAVMRRACARGDLAAPIWPPHARMGAPANAAVS